MHFTPIITTNFDDQTISEDLNNGKTKALIDPTHPSTPLCRLNPPSILEKSVVVKYIHRCDMFSLGRSLVSMNMLTLATATYPSWQFIQYYYRTFIYPKASTDSRIIQWSGPAVGLAICDTSWLHFDFLNQYLI